MIANTMMNISNLVLRVSYIVKAVSHLWSYNPGESSKILGLLAWLYAFGQARTERKWKPLFFAFWLFPSFRLGLGREDADEITPLGHLFRFISFRKVDLKLAPSPPDSGPFRTMIKNGIWQRHKTELALSQSSTAYRAFMPFQRYDWTKPFTLVYFLSDPEDVEQVLMDRESFPTRGHSGFTDLAGEGLLGMPSGEKHSKHRRVVINFLSDTHLRNFSLVVSDQIEVLLEKWGCSTKECEKPTSTAVATRRFNAQYDLSMLTLDIIMLTAFGAGKEYLSQHIPEEENHLAHGLDFVLKDIVLRTAIVFWKYIPSPRQFRIKSLIAEGKLLQENLFKDSLKRTEENPNGPSTMLSEMLRLRKSKDADSAGLTDQEIADELQTIRGAGHETTSNTLSWVMLLLARHPHVLEKLRQEAEKIVKGANCTFDESKELRYHAQVVYETLRLYPTVPSFPRECHQDVVLKSGKYDLPAGSMIFVSQNALNRSTKLWDRPNDFLPERFEGIGELAMGKPVGVPNGMRYGFAPFGAGNRSCVGQRLAILEAVQILASIVLRCDWKLAEPDTPIIEVADITLGPKHGLIFEISPRKRNN